MGEQTVMEMHAFQTNTSKTLPSPEQKNPLKASDMHWYTSMFIYYYLLHFLLIVCSLNFKIKYLFVYNVVCWEEKHKLKWSRERARETETEILYPEKSWVKLKGAVGKFSQRRCMRRWLLLYHQKRAVPPETMDMVEAIQACIFRGSRWHQVNVPLGDQRRLRMNGVPLAL